MKNATYATTPPRPDVQAVLDKLKPGQRIRITQTVRVGMKTWNAVITGAFRHYDSMATGLATHRVPVDDVIIPIVHFTKEPHGELSSVAIDENTKIEILE
jgi:hypothetical protein